MANPIYKQSVACRIAFCMFIALIAMAFPHNLMAQPNLAYTIEGVEVDVTAKNAVLAREKALDEAQSKAYQMLAERLLTPEEVASLKIPDPITLSSLVQDFEVVKEQASSVRYKGTYIVRFRPNAMKSQMASQGKTYSDTIKKPVMVLPIFGTNDQSVLWGDSNPWMMAWRNLPADKSLLQPMVIPLGDAQDISELSGDEGIQIDPMAVQELASRYNADDVAILLATSKKNTGQLENLDINLYKNGFEGVVFVKTITIPSLPNEAQNVFYARAAAQLKSVLRGEWKGDVIESQTVMNETVAPTQPAVPYTPPVLGPSSIYMVVAKFSSVQEWVKLKSTVDKIYGIQGTMIKGLKPREATLELRFAGDGLALSAALQNAGITMKAGAQGAPFEIYPSPSLSNRVY